MSEPLAKVVEAERFLLRDSRERVRAELAVESDGPILKLLGMDGPARLVRIVTHGGLFWPS
jgi:hypothetical protein